MEFIQKRLRESAELKLRLGSAELEPFRAFVDATCRALRDGGKLLLFGNGGSAADAQHIAAELVGRYALDRPGMPAIALTTDSSILTSVGNDYGFDSIFERQIEALAAAGDVALGISTSGNSNNVKRGLLRAKRIGRITTAALLGRTGGDIRTLVDHAIVIPAHDTARIQECHITLGHILCEMVEADVAERSAREEA
ncbi:MAG: D-sedoheptulose 7-phosphate isomerase [Candidatus Latescibacterota bacterium]|nr:MAG: D-sedoheptulose 7-phosphate isomerase [Candidatus Latescibacterota bacterium]